ncbi:YggS family pyridoxal phosphate-dependent enzyme [Enterocloster asparagiformis]|uniref:YggS family pyridoxal phosphate-dependent enzyme n=1 Tax=Enterocloster asparagiformis TaxID=333367 RepID=UPI000464E77C|nr:YggS family pyridoxal phosphate-dependent enzyme [Enterocloster asparagiformis]
MIKEQLEEVRERVNAACLRAGRDPKSVTLIAVSKTKPAQAVQEAYEAGARDFGENKVQEILQKQPALPQDIRWHMIGHLQRNKVHQVIGKAVLIHAVDSLRLAEQIEQEAAKQNLDVDVLLEINVAKEESKYGFFLEDAEEAIRRISALPHVHIKGLMTIAPFVENPEENRGIFQKLYQFSVDINDKNIDNVTMGVLSMGMSGDFEVAIEEGATMVRIGTSIFGAR